MNLPVPIRGLLRDCKIFANIRIAIVLSFVTGPGQPRHRSARKKIKQVLSVEHELCIHHAIWLPRPAPLSRHARHVSARAWARGRTVDTRHSWSRGMHHVNMIGASLQCGHRVVPSLQQLEFSNLHFDIHNILRGHLWLMTILACFPCSVVYLSFWCATIF